jgi:hypothetical protein
VLLDVLEVLLDVLLVDVVLEVLDVLDVLEVLLDVPLDELLDVPLDDVAAEELACDEEDEAVLSFSVEGVEKTPDIKISATTATTTTVPAT